MGCGWEGCLVYRRQLLRKKAVQVCRGYVRRVLPSVPIVHRKEPEGSGSGLSQGCRFSGFRFRVSGFSRVLPSVSIVHRKDPGGVGVRVESLGELGGWEPGVLPVCPTEREPTRGNWLQPFSGSFRRAFEPCGLNGVHRRAVVAGLCECGAPHPQSPAGCVRRTQPLRIAGQPEAGRGVTGACPPLYKYIYIYIYIYI